MRRWQRAITILIMMVFTPVALLAGASLRHCVGSDGHSAIEFVLVDAQHHTGAQHSHIAGNHDNAAAVATDGSECSDRPLITVSQRTIASQTVRVKQLAADTPVMPVAFWATAWLLSFDDRQAADIPPLPRETTADLRLEWRRSVVLLI